MRAVLHNEVDVSFGPNNIVTPHYVVMSQAFMYINLSFEEFQAR